MADLPDTPSEEGNDVEALPEAPTDLAIECPHCHKQFTATPMEGSAARYRGFKCPHCRLFVPYERVTG